MNNKCINLNDLYLLEEIDTKKKKHNYEGKILIFKGYEKDENGKISILFYNLDMKKNYVVVFNYKFLFSPTSELVFLQENCPSYLKKEFDKLTKCAVNNFVSFEDLRNFEKDALKTIKNTSIVKSFHEMSMARMYFWFQATKFPFAYNRLPTEKSDILLKQQQSILKGNVEKNDENLMTH